MDEVQPRINANDADKKINEDLFNDSDLRHLR